MIQSISAFPGTYEDNPICDCTYLVWSREYIQTNYSWHLAVQYIAFGLKEGVNKNVKLLARYSCLFYFVPKLFKLWWQLYWPKLFNLEANTLPRGWPKPKSSGLNQEPNRNKDSWFGSCLTISGTWFQHFSFFMVEPRSLGLSSLC